MKIAIIGAGSVGTNLHYGLQLKGIRAELVHARPLTADPSAVNDLPQADVYIYTVADNAFAHIGFDADHGLWSRQTSFGYHVFLPEFQPGKTDR